MQKVKNFDKREGIMILAPAFIYALYILRYVVT